MAKVAENVLGAARHENAWLLRRASFGGLMRLKESDAVKNERGDAIRIKTSPQERPAYFLSVTDIAAQTSVPTTAFTSWQLLEFDTPCSMCDHPHTSFSLWDTPHAREVRRRTPSSLLTTCQPYHGNWMLMLNSFVFQLCQFHELIFVVRSSFHALEPDICTVHLAR